VQCIGKKIVDVWLCRSNPVSSLLILAGGKSAATDRVRTLSGEARSIRHSSGGRSTAPGKRKLDLSLRFIPANANGSAAPETFRSRQK
jgi:hypothetical protein